MMMMNIYRRLSMTRKGLTSLKKTLIFTTHVFKRHDNTGTSSVNNGTDTPSFVQIHNKCITHHDECGRHNEKPASLLTFPVTTDSIALKAENGSRCRNSDINPKIR